MFKQKAASALVALFCVAIFLATPIHQLSHAATTTSHPSSNLAQNNTTSLAAANNQFAFDFYHVIQDAEGNLFYSPFSIWQAFAMTYGGARGDTAAQMETALHFPVAQDELPVAMRDLTDTISNSAMSEEISDDERLQLNIANAFWGSDDFPFIQDYVTQITDYYNTSVEYVDFQGDAGNVASQINEWVAAATENKITDVVSPDSFDDTTRLVMINAIYFNASWLYQFEEEDTFDEDFTLINDNVISVPTMYLRAGLAYTDRLNYQALELPYVGDNLAMLLFLPDEGEFESFQQSFSVETFDETINALRSHDDVRLYLPSFEYDFEQDLKAPLMNLGIDYVFDPFLADLTGIANVGFEDEENLYISNALHKAYVLVDESGTEAAAVTVQSHSVLLEIQEDDHIEIRFDRPFFFAIYDRPTQTILFIGRVMDPS